MTLWMLDLQRRATTPFVIAGGSSQAPVWSADGRHVFYRGTRKGSRNIYRKSADGSGDEERLTTKEGVVQSPTSASPDGKWLLFSEAGREAGQGVWLLPLDPAGAREADRTPRQFRDPPTACPALISLRMAAGSRTCPLCQDALKCTRSPFPVPARVPRFPRWAATSRGGRVTAVSCISARQTGVSWPPTCRSAPRSRRAFPARCGKDASKDAVNANTAFDVAKDGRIRIVQQAETGNVMTHIDVVLNWFSLLTGGASTK